MLNPSNQAICIISENGYACYFGHFYGKEKISEKSSNYLEQLVVRTGKCLSNEVNGSFRDNLFLGYRSQNYE